MYIHVLTSLSIHMCNVNAYMHILYVRVYCICTCTCTCACVYTYIHVHVHYMLTHLLALDVLRLSPVHNNLGGVVTRRGWRKTWAGGIGLRLEAGGWGRRRGHSIHTLEVGLILQAFEEPVHKASCLWGWGWG